jgi:HJR/Mrr/RecB family endonuclease
MLNGAGEIGATDFDMREVAPPEVPATGPRVLAFDDVLTMQPRHFEAYAAVLWARMGFPTVTLTPAAGDNGVDVVAVKGTTGQLIQCKTSHRTGRELGWDAIKDVVTGHAAYRLQYPGVDFKRVCVTTQSFNAGACRHAALNDVELIDGVRLAEIHDSYQITLEDVERALYAGGALAQ